MRAFDFSRAQILPSLPRRARSVVFVGAGGIVNSAELPAYLEEGIPIRGIFDVDREAAHATASAFGVGRVFDSLAQAVIERNVVFDVAVPASEITRVLDRLPRGAPVLIQKPLGRDLAEARRIAHLCTRRRLRAAVNFQLRHAPNMLALTGALARGVFGELTDVEVRVNTHTPWARWAFLAGIPRLEILYHSIHYLDLIRSWLGEPSRVHAWVGSHPSSRGYADTRSAILLDFGPTTRCVLSLNHEHRFGLRHAASELRIEGVRGAAVATMGVNLDYPKGEVDRLSICAAGDQWQDVPLRGSWFRAAFAGPMIALQRWTAGGTPSPTRVADAVRTMALVEACYLSAMRPRRSGRGRSAPRA